MSNVIEPHILRRMEREYASKSRASVGASVDRFVHIRNDRLVIGNEEKGGIITRYHGLPFGTRAAIAFINKSRVLGSTFSRFK